MLPFNCDSVKFLHTFIVNITQHPYNQIYSFVIYTRILQWKINCWKHVQWIIKHCVNWGIQIERRRHPHPFNSILHSAGLGEGSQHSEGSRNGIKFRICLTISSVNTWHPCHWIIWKDEFQSTHIHIDSSSSFIHTFAEKEWKGANKQRSIEKG